MVRCSTYGARDLLTCRFLDNRDLPWAGACSRQHTLSECLPCPGGAIWAVGHLLGGHLVIEGHCSSLMPAAQGHRCMQPTCLCGAPAGALVGSLVCRQPSGAAIAWIELAGAFQIERAALPGSSAGL